MSVAVSGSTVPDQASAEHAARDLKDSVGLEELNTVVLATPTVTGLLRGKEYDLAYFAEHVRDRGAHAAGYLLTTDVDMRMLPGFPVGGWEQGAGDIVLVPDMGAVWPIAWAPGAALVVADAHDPRSGEPIDFAPRTVLARAISRLKAVGPTASLGIESEAMVYDIDYRDAARRGWRDLPPAADHNTDYALARPTRLNELIDGIRACAYASRLPLEAIKTEAGAGQLEATFRHSDPMRAADNHTLYKLVAHHAASAAGMALTFMAKPFTGLDGNSGHLHLSLLNGHGTSIVVDSEGQLTKTGRQAVAGCLAVLDQLAVLMLPTVNAYKRLHTEGPPLFAPTTLTWGYDNRTCALRVVGAGQSGRIECRIPGADSQPHLAAAALITAVAHGIAEGLELKDPPVTGSAYAVPRARTLPRSLGEARELMEHSKLVASLLGPEVVEHYATVARHEDDFHRLHVSDLERERGFARA